MESGLRLEIEAVLRDRMGRECLLTPSGRVALWLALRTWLSPGARLLLSPCTDDVVLFVVLAAGLRPVMAPLSPCDGNIDPFAIPEATWKRVDGVLTTNLYGMPDRVVELRARCERDGLVLIEDVAHAIETEVGGRPIGAFGAAAAVSLSKHVAAPGGGALVFADAGRRPDLERLLGEVTTPRTPGRRAADVLSPAAERLVRALGLFRPARWAWRSLGLVERAEGNRMPLRAPLLREAVAHAPDLVRFDPWVRFDLHGYRMALTGPQLSGILARLRRLDGDRARRVEGVLRLRELPGTAAPAREGPPRPLLRVPLLVEDRDGVQAELRRRLVTTTHVFDPPLDDYATAEFVDPSSSPEAARWWGSHVLPVDPLDAGRVLRALGGMGTPPRPARPPSGTGP
jgi:dTDP-4-amino-4,6-dideoxygalactose transaminase